MAYHSLEANNDDTIKGPDDYIPIEKDITSMDDGRVSRPHRGLNINEQNADCFAFALDLQQYCLLPLPHISQSLIAESPDLRFTLESSDEILLPLTGLIPNEGRLPAGQEYLNIQLMLRKGRRGSTLIKLRLFRGDSLSAFSESEYKVFVP